MIMEFARKAYRTLEVAKAESPGAWRCVGLVALYNPLREAPAATIKAARQLGGRGRGTI